ncbi:MAG: HAMP domain-containing histidine kinase [Actinobacteria bacterium]|nr:HAMP domain-containing histidine kinase [Actinomycetota bacterium]MCG2819223.1 HAMP domain-containing histidine kinase [Actinomycetes bacterium]MBU4218314.1 HAMP domain-containing histidine kinase [Actinomycetota bacterium]MBU4357874.1 HAMP domain-containing histidine kinase [Actinomycetota bacterium]MBU4390957.1 HAMP domain-containing histidine kinase [Actinomycetota bacterium]
MSIKKATVLRAVVSALLVAGVATGGVLITLKVADFQRVQYFDLRKFQAAAAAATLDFKEIESLRGSSEDVGTPAFEELRSQLIRIRNTDPRLTFVYLMRPGGDEMVFLVDAEDPESEDYSPPGQVYEEALPGDFLVFKGKRSPVAKIEGPITDRWGTWISATAYILDDKGKPVALLGTDVDVERALASFNDIRYMGILFTVLFSVLLALILLQWILWRHMRDRREALRREMEESIVRLNTELLEADRLKSEFIESASHELRGPATAVDGALQVMDHELSGELSDIGRELLEIALSGSNRLVDLVGDLLDLTSIEAGGIAINPVEVDAGELVRTTVSEFLALAREKGLTLESRVEEGEPGRLEVFADPKVLLRVLENLVANAIKYTDSSEITVAVKAVDDMVRFTVRDTGRGIPKRFEDEVFKRFSRLHLYTGSEERGAGLGLAISMGLAETHSGRILVESEEGKGSTFYFDVPRHYEPAD